MESCTLESVCQVKGMFTNIFPSKEIKSCKEFGTFDLSVLKEKVDNVFYYGLLSHPDGSKIELYNFDKKRITIEENSQIIELFQNLKFRSYDDDSEVAENNGQFRGYQIILSN